MSKIERRDSKVTNSVSFFSLTIRKRQNRRRQRSAWTWTHFCSFYWPEFSNTADRDKRLARARRIRRPRQKVLSLSCAGYVARGTWYDVVGLYLHKHPARNIAALRTVDLQESTEHKTTWCTKNSVYLTLSYSHYFTTYLHNFTYSYIHGTLRWLH